MTIKFSPEYPDRLEYEPPAKENILNKIRCLHDGIPEETLQKLGQQQAVCLYYSIINSKRVMQDTIDKCSEMMKEFNTYLETLL